MASRQVFHRDYLPPLHDLFRDEEAQGVEMCLKKYFMFMIVTAGLMLINGCSFKDIDKRFFVVAMGMDWTGKADKPYLVTLRLAIPASKIGEGLAETQVEKFEAESVAEAVRNMKSHVDKELDFGHCRVFLFGNSLVNQSLEEPMNWLSRRRDIQLVSFLAVAEPSANKVLLAKPASERLAGDSFWLTFGKEGTISPYTVTAKLFDSLRRFTEKGMDPYLPVLSFDGDSYVVEHLALFNKQKELLVINPQETSLYNLTANAFSRSGIAINYEGKRLVFYISRASRSVSITKDEIPTVRLKLKLTGMVEESPVILMGGKVLEVKRLLEDHVNEIVEELMIKIRDAGVDPYGFGLHYLAQYSGNDEDWKHWQEVYPHIKYEINTQVNIESTGLIR
jgi:spore germination protein KC